ncbi:MAG: hypothetical protein N2B06_08460 [Clostridium sp.]
MKRIVIKELTVVIIIITISIIGILKLNETIDYQIKITNINKFIVTQDYDGAEKSIRAGDLKFKDIGILQEKIKEGKEAQNMK